MNTYEIVLSPLLYSPGGDNLIELFKAKTIRVQGTKMDFMAGPESEYFIIRNDKEVVYLVPSHTVRSCRVLKKAKVLSVVADKDV
jgi:hypothetical protein